ncbi:hypothetical protein LDENG_00075210 [Lucifuga dentata]|nr:hypothetical protein LDENG_00075210 [Lucifuga dentata]
MSGYFTVWVSCMLSPFLLAVGAIDCSEKETLLRKIPSTIMQPTDCLMECTGLTYIKKMQLQDNHNIRFKDSTEGKTDLGEYCWSTNLQCTIGESFQHAFVVLPVDMSVIGQEQLELKSTAPTASTLDIHNSTTTIADSCGLRYDVTHHFNRENTGTSFCVQIVTQQSLLGDRLLKCPPFLVTLWQRVPNQSKQEGGG